MTTLQYIELLREGLEEKDAAIAKVTAQRDALLLVVKMAVKTMEEPPEFMHTVNTDAYRHCKAALFLCSSSTK